MAGVSAFSIAALFMFMRVAQQGEIATPSQLMAGLAVIYVALAVLFMLEATRRA
jgi:hypothetical protein